MTQLNELFPEVTQIRDPKLKGAVLKTWRLALERAKTSVANLASACVDWHHRLSAGRAG